ncbi:hypothetical protein AMS68_004142 [Peltaster fructicola]|uniref:Uncharacterized protein n=1 Tax=Peltaster fructicola TaxID=286661 RepID=A0A6H0XVE1_9PEZI|nr:hypothetical protein AMS68_004142 [Peltaster fructicola]
MSTTFSLASSTATSALAMPTSTGYSNTTSVTNGLWPNVTCSNTENFKSIPQPSISFADGTAYITVMPANEKTWPSIVGCFGKGANITVGDGGVGCYAQAINDVAAPGVAYQCLRKAFQWNELGCAGDVNYACATSSVPSALIASKIAQASSMSTATSSTTSSTTASAAAITSAKSSAQAVRPRSIGKTELAVASMLAFSLVFGIAL